MNTPITPQSAPTPAAAPAPVTPTPVAPVAAVAPVSTKLSLQQFGQQIQTKYPQYKSMDSVEVANKVLEKYPQYADKVNVPAKAPAPYTGDIFANTPEAAQAREATVTHVGKALTDTGSGIASDLSIRANHIADIFRKSMNGQVMSPTDALVGGAKIASEATGGISDVASRAFKAFSDIVSSNPEIQKLAQSKGVGAVLDTVSGAGEQAGTLSQPAQDAVKTWAAAHPEVASLVKSIGSTGLNLSLLEGAPEAAGKAAELAAKGKTAAGDLITKGADTVSSMIPAAADKTASSVASYIDSSGQKVFTRLSPEELASLKDEVKNIPQQSEGVSQIHLDPANPQTINGSKELSREEFIAGHPQAKGMFDNVSSLNDSQATIADTISPKLNAKETQAAINDSRVTRGKESFLFGKQPDIVAQSDEIKQAARTIDTHIPNASKMNDVQLSSALDGKTKEIAENLRPSMQQVPINQATTGKVVDAWKSIKTAQEAEPEYDAFAGSAKAQAKFESYLKNLNWDTVNPETGKFQTPTAKNLDDIWQTRIDYDNSIPANVKTATTASAPSLQWQKTMWLQNRSLLNSAIHDEAAGLGSESKQAFSDMSDMYLAKQNILSKAKIDTEGAAGLLPSNKAQLLKWGIGVGGGVIGLDVLLHRLGL